MSTPRSAPSQRPGGLAMRGPMGAMMGPPQKAKNFKSSARRLFARLAPERSRVIAVLAFAIASVTLSVLGPLVMREATRAIIAGFFGQKFPATMSASEVIASLHASGHDVVQRFGDLSNPLLPLEESASKVGAQSGGHLGEQLLRSGRHASRVIAIEHATAARCREPGRRVQRRGRVRGSATRHQD